MKFQLISKYHSTWRLIAATPQAAARPTGPHSGRP